MGLNQRLFGVCFKIGLTTIGGGFAMIPMMEYEIVDKAGWLTREEFIDVLSVAQTSPGIFGVNMATYIGYKLGGVSSAMVAALANILPSFIIILTIAYGARALQDNVWVEYAFKGLRPAVVALIVAPVCSLARSAKLTVYTMWLPILCVLLISFFGVSPIFVILAIGLLGGFYGLWLARRAKDKIK